MQPQGMEQAAMTSDKDWTVLLILSIVLGSLGVDHFYSGKIGTGILKLITLGACWYLGYSSTSSWLLQAFQGLQRLPVTNK
jgi:TM2 domain-containing membrane protein YozV